MQPVKLVFMTKGTVTQSFNEVNADFLESKGWVRGAKARSKPKPEPTNHIVTSTEPEDK